jgi:hypothetical protein
MMASLSIWKVEAAMPDKVRKREVEAGSKEKTCSACGRRMEWRKSWAKNWDEVKFCSDACRRGKVSARDRALEEAIVRLLRERGEGKTICPSEAARAVGGEDRAAWEPMMEPARAAARRLVAAGRIEITQGGSVVDGSTAKGPIRLRSCADGERWSCADGERWSCADGERWSCADGERWSCADGER